MNMKLNRVLYLPAFFLLGVWGALLWVSGTLENTFDLGRPGLQIPAEAIDRERYAVLDAKDLIGIVTPVVVLITGVIDQYLSRRTKGGTETHKATD